MDYFDKLVELMTPIFNTDPYSIVLNFNGLKEDVSLYTSCDVSECDIKELANLARKLNTWSNYVGDILSLAKKVMLDCDTRSKEMTAAMSVKYDKFNTSVGERLASREPEVVNKKLDYNTASAFVSLLENKKNFLERAYYHCKSIYEIRTKMENHLA